MQMTGEQRVAAPRQRVWEALNDPEVLRAAIPGCQTLERDGDDRFVATVEIKIGPIGARFKGAVTIADRDPPSGYRLVGEGNGGIAGSAKGEAGVKLTDDGAGTLVSYTVDAQVGGRLAQLGGPIIDATAKQLAAKFFDKLGQIVSGAEAPAPVTEAAAAAPVATVAAPPAAFPIAPAPAAAAGFPWSLVVAVAVAVLGGFLLGRSEAAEWWVVAVIVLATVMAGAGYEAGKRGTGR
jgi:carbon monoxide dehydrogenase subunit G